MKNQECDITMFYDRKYMLFPPEDDDIDLKCNIISVVMRQMTYQWFGHLVSPSWWSEFWLSQALTEYFRLKLTDTVSWYYFENYELC